MGPENQIELLRAPTAEMERRPPAFLSAAELPKGDEGPNLRAYWRVVQKRRWMILSVQLLVFTVVLIATLKENPVYRAKALLEIEKENPGLLTVPELLQIESVSDSYLETQYRILQSESLAWRVITELHLDTAREFNPSRSGLGAGVEAMAAGKQRDLSDPGEVEDRPGVLRRFADRLAVKPVAGSRLVQVSFESEEPELAAQIINTLAANYIQQNLETRWAATQKASEWLSEQLQDLKARLEKSEDQLQQYAEANGLLFLETEKGNPENVVHERLRQLQDELTRAQADRYQKESLYRLVEAREPSALPGAADNKLVQELTSELATLKRQKAELAASFTESYPKMQQVQSQIERIQQLAEEQRKRAAQGIAEDYQTALRREALVRQAFEQQHGLANVVAAKSVQYNILKRDVDTSKQLYEGLLQRLKEAGVAAGLKASNIRVVDEAVPSAEPVKPVIFLNLTLAVVLGSCCGVGLAFLQEHLDNTMKTPDDVQRFLGAPALAMIPAQDALDRHSAGVYGLLENRSGLRRGNGQRGEQKKEAGRGWIRIDVDASRYAALSEAFRSLRTSVLLSTANRPPRSLTILSAQPKEGKTTVSTNLAISLAQLGKRVLLIDGDMRCPCIHKLFQIQKGFGLVGYLTGQQDWREQVHRTELADLHCLACGPVPPNPSELLSSERMRALIQQATAEYDFVLVDSSPVLSVADARILAALTEGTVLVARCGVTPRELVQRAQLQVTEVGAHLIGVVLNGMDLRQNGYYGYGYYQYRYGNGEQKETQKG